MSIIFLIATLMGTATVMAFVIRSKGTQEPTVPSMIRTPQRDVNR